MKYYVKSVLHPDCVPKSQQEEFNKWRSPALSTTLARRTFNWTRQPLQAGMGARGAWLSLATSAKAYRQLKSGLTGISIPMAQLAQIPLGANRVVESGTGESYRSPKLVRMGVFQVGDLLVGDKLDEEKVRCIAPTWRELYRRGIMWMLRQRDGGK